jgi:hypothetical protein
MSRTYILGVFNVSACSKKYKKTRISSSASYTTLTYVEISTLIRSVTTKVITLKKIAKCPQPGSNG